MVYSLLLRRTRRQLHLRIAEVLAKQFPVFVENQPEQLAHHYTEADHGVLALPYWRRAIRSAVRRAAHAEARQYLDKAKELLQTLPTSAECREHELALQLLERATMARRGRAIDLF